MARSFRIARFPASNASKSGGGPVKLYSYVVARDFGFAPNPFHGYCTLATCKPDIRATASVGDWVIGTGAKPHELEGHLVYAMRVSEILTYDSYWQDERFRMKRPYLHGSLKQAFGDNIYHRDVKTGCWIQADSHHSFEGGLANNANIKQDTGSENVLISKEFYFFGGSAPAIPERFLNWNGNSVCKKGPSHKCTFPDDLIASFVGWVRSLGVSGYIDEPAQFRADHD